MDDPEVPKELIDALCAMRSPEVPPAVDEAILASARRRMRALGRRPVLLRWWAGGAVAAAAVIALLALRPWTPRPHAEAARVTILDAFALARRIEAGAPRLDDDVNRDGRVDRGDVDSLASIAVALPPRTEGVK